MTHKISVIFSIMLMVCFLGFMVGLQSDSKIDTYKSSEELLFQNVDYYASHIVNDLESQFKTVGIKAKMGVTDVKINGESATVSMLMERYDPLLNDSFKSVHVTQWRLEKGEWVI